jgi:glycerol-3-phosphate O-acyltransferase
MLNALIYVYKIFNAMELIFLYLQMVINNVLLRNKHVSTAKFMIQIHKFMPIIKFVLMLSINANLYQHLYTSILKKLVMNKPVKIKQLSE